MTREGSNDGLLHREITSSILESFFQVHYELGFGFLESIYAKAMEHVLIESGHHVRRESPIDVFFRGERSGHFRADLIVESAVLVEIKCAEQLDPNAQAQVLNYLRATNIEVALLLHFGPKARFKRFVFANHRKLLPR
ncbi:MAG TPA: GxxExxY protein [Gemmatimonadaceae bacterium]|nr:GxxExxY protein [Gemmatimonadaceae bacterium]